MTLKISLFLAVATVALLGLTAAAPQSLENLEGLDLSLLVGRGRAVPGNEKDEKEKKPTVAILRQINEQNEDGSYTYGYEAADGSFKLETRYPDGLVQGKYGYIDIDTGEVKVIEYGADMMGFQPAGDLPEGIIIPKPVFNNFTAAEDLDYDYEYSSEEVDRPKFEDESRVVVENRARLAFNGQKKEMQKQSREQERHQQRQEQRKEERQQEQDHAVKQQRQEIRRLPAASRQAVSPPRQAATAAPRTKFPTQPPRQQLFQQEQKQETFRNNQNRGQALELPITSRPLPRTNRPRLAVPQSAPAARPKVDPFQTAFSPITRPFQARSRPAAAPAPVTAAPSHRESQRIFSPTALPAVPSQQQQRQPQRQQQHQQQQQQSQRRQQQQQQQRQQQQHEPAKRTPQRTRPTRIRPRPTAAPAAAAVRVPAVVRSPTARNPTRNAQRGTPAPSRPAAEAFDPISALQAIASGGASRAAPTSLPSRSPASSASRNPAPSASRNPAPSASRSLSRGRNPIRPPRPASSSPRETPRRSSVTSSSSSSSSSSSDENRFSSFPVRSSPASPRSSSRPEQPSRSEPSRSAPEAATPAERPTRIRSRPSRPQPTEAPQQQFSQFQARPQQPQILPPSPRQRQRQRQQQQRQQTAQSQVLPTAQVDFDSLIQQFTGGRTSSLPAPKGFPTGGQFAPVPAVPSLPNNQNGASFSLVTGV